VDWGVPCEPPTHPAAVGAPQRYCRPLDLPVVEALPTSPATPGPCDGASFRRADTCCLPYAFAPRHLVAWTGGAAPLKCAQEKSLPPKRQISNGPKPPVGSKITRPSFDVDRQVADDEPYFVIRAHDPLVALALVELHALYRRGAGPARPQQAGRDHAIDIGPPRAAARPPARNTAKPSPSRWRWNNGATGHQGMKLAPVTLADAHVRLRALRHGCACRPLAGDDGKARRSSSVAFGRIPPGAPVTGSEGWLENIASAQLRARLHPVFARSLGQRRGYLGITSYS